MTVAVVDASALVALLADAGRQGTWAADALVDQALAAPQLLHFEVANVLRRHEAAGRLGREEAAWAHRDLVDLAVEVWPYSALGGRVWELRHNLSAYDAAYVALAELLDAPLVTCDRRLAGAPGARCTFATP